MGNVAPCAPSIIFTSTVKIVFIDGRLHVYTSPIKASDLMIDNPGSFLSDLSDLKIGHRILGISADEILQPRRTYFLLPMEMLYSVLTGDEMSFLNEIAPKQGSMNSCRILPGCLDFKCLLSRSDSNKKLMGCDGKKESKDENDDFFVGWETQWTWRPSLKTIVEVPTPPNDWL